MRKVDEETNAETWKLSKMRHELNAWRNYISHKIDFSKELDADFNFLNIHLMSHWVKQIRQHGTFQLYSAEKHEQAQQMNLKDGSNASSHNLNCAASNRLSVSNSLLRNQRAQSPSPHSALGEQCCRLHSPPFRCWSACPPEVPGKLEAWIPGMPKPPWWKASWHFDQRLQSITWQYARHNAPRGNIQPHAGVYQA